MVLDIWAMARGIQVTFDAASPRQLGLFWAAALGYVEQPPPPGFESWDDALDAMGIDRSDPDRAFAVVDPDCVGPRLFFQRVPEPKSAKNRVHLDVRAAPDQLLARAAELVVLGARLVEEVDEPGGHFITMLDPEGNEFCLQR